MAAAAAAGAASPTSAAEYAALVQKTYAFNPADPAHERLLHIIVSALHGAETTRGKWGAWIVYDAVQYLMFPAPNPLFARDVLVNFQKLVVMSQLEADSKTVPNSETMEADAKWWVAMHAAHGGGIWLPPLKMLQPVMFAIN